MAATVHTDLTAANIDVARLDALHTAEQARATAAESARTTAEGARATAETARTAADTALVTAQNRVRTLEAEVNEYEAEGRSWWYDRLSVWDVVIFFLVAIASTIGLYVNIRLETDSAVFNELTFQNLMSLMFPTLGGVLIAVGGITLGRIMRGWAGEWAGGLICVIGVLFAVNMFTDMHTKLIKVERHPDLATNTAPMDFDVVCVKQVNLPTEYDEVVITTQIVQKLDKAKADAITPATPHEVKVPKGSHGNVFTQGVLKGKASKPSRSNDF